MSTIRSPKKAVAKCTEPDCKWTRIYWEFQETMSAAARADLGLKTHRRLKHPIAGSVQNAQHLRPVMR